MARHVLISPVDFDVDVTEARDSCNVSFIVPAFQAMRTLESSIDSIRAAAPESSEVIIVDDGSLDDTATLAARLGDLVVHRPCQGGAARSRNDGARVARGDILVFVDSDVTVTASAVAGALRHLEEGADAVFGAYEPLPPPYLRNAATTYKNLLHHFTHLEAAGDVNTFWSGFGAVTRQAFLAVRGFDPAVTTGADVEDIHLGYRLRAAGYRIVLDPTLQVLHHKRYTIRGVIASDVFHRAIPWTRALLQLRTFSNDLNLRRQSIVAGAVSLGIPVALCSVRWIGLSAIPASGVLAATWLALHRKFLNYVRRTWSVGGAVRSAGFMYLYYFYGVVGTALGAVAFVLRHDRHSMLNWLRLEAVSTEEPDVSVTVAVIAGPGEPLATLGGLPTAAPWWELIVVATEPRDDVPPEARFILAPSTASRNYMRQLALEVSTGEMFATLDARCVPNAGWLDRVREAAGTAVVVVAGPFDHDRRSIRRRAEQVVRYWQWRPERAPGWLVDHPSTNAAFRTAAAQGLGGFKIEGALIARLAGLGARPVRFDPRMTVTLTSGSTTVRQFLRGVAGVSRLRASAGVRYLDIGWLHRLTLVAVSPVSGAVSLGRIVRQAIEEHSADKTFWLGLPMITAGLVSHWLGRDLGLLRPRLRGGVVPRGTDDLRGLEHESIPARP